MSQLRTHASRRHRAPANRSRLESLETRTLFSGITAFSVPDASSPDFLTNMTQDNTSNLWIAAGDANLYKVAQADASVTTYTITTPANFGYGIDSVAFNPQDGHLYAAFDSSGTVGGIAQLDLNGNVTATYTVTADAEIIAGLSIAPDGAVWFSAIGNARSIGRLDPSTGASILNTIPNGDTDVATPNSAIVFGANGSAWVGGNTSDLATPLLYNVTVNGSSLAFQRYVVGANAQMSAIAVSPSGDLWFASAPVDNSTYGNWGNYVDAPEQLHQVSLATGTPSVTNGIVDSTEFDVPMLADGAPSMTSQIAFDATGTLWFNQSEDADGNGMAPDQNLVSLDPNSGDFSTVSVSDYITPYTVVAGSNGIWSSGSLPQNGSSSMTNLVKLDPSQPPLAGVDPVISAQAGQTFSGDIATFVSSGAGPFTYTLDYGNGTSASGTIAADSTGVYTVSGSATYANAGTYNLLLTVSDGAGDVITLNGQAVITDATTTLSAQGVDLQGEKDVALAPNVVGQSQVIVAQFQGVPASYTASIDWGDNTSTVGDIISMGDNQYYVAIPSGDSKTYTAIGDFNVTVTITDGTNTVTASSVASITADPIVASQNLVLHPLFGPVFVGTVATFTADPASSANWFTATITWGDGRTSRGIVIRTASGEYKVLGVHIYRQPGTYAVDTNLVDTVDSETALATASIQIG